MDKTTIDQVKQLLQEIIDAETSLPKEELEVVYDRVLEKARALPRDGIVALVDKAVGRSKQRRKAAIYLYSQMTDVPEAAERIGQAVFDKDHELRSWVVQTIGGEKLAQFAELLNTVMREDEDPFVRQCAVLAAADIGSDVNIATLLQLAEQPDAEITSAVLWALTKYGRPESRKYLTGVFTDRRRDDHDRVIAAWGLAKLGDEKAYAYLLKMLDDKDQEAGRWARFKHKVLGVPLVLFSPGQSFRAAQAICDLHQWPFDGSAEGVEQTRQCLSQEGKPPRLPRKPTD